MKIRSSTPFWSFVKFPSTKSHREAPGGYKCGEWLQSDKIWLGRLRVVSCKDQCEIRLENPNSGELFAGCFVQPGQRENSVEAILDSSRYFVLEYKDLQEVNLLARKDEREASSFEWPRRWRSGCRGKQLHEVMIRAALDDSSQ